MGKSLAWFLQQLAQNPLADQIEVLVAGTMPDRFKQRIASTASHLHVQWIGFVRPVELMEQIDCLIVPSLWHEPLGRVILEAFAYGVPVLAAQAGGIPELIRHGRNGRLFRSETPSDVIRQLWELLSKCDQWSDYRARAWESRTDYIPQKIAAEYLEFYDTVSRAC